MSACVCVAVNGWVGVGVSGWVVWDGWVGVGEWVGAGCMECPWVSYTSPREACDLWS